MATQGMINIYKKNKDDKIKILVKIICGCDGQKENLEEVVKTMKHSLTMMLIALERKSFLRKKDLLKYLYRIAKQHIGCRNCLVVMDKKTKYYEGDEEISDLYRKKFNDFYFNPRWESGLIANITSLQVY